MPRLDLSPLRRARSAPAHGRDRPLPPQFGRADAGHPAVPDKAEGRGCTAPALRRAGRADAGALLQPASAPYPPRPTPTVLTWLSIFRAACSVEFAFRSRRIRDWPRQLSLPSEFPPIRQCQPDCTHKTFRPKFACPVRTRTWARTLRSNSSSKVVSSTVVTLFLVRISSTRRLAISRTGRTKPAIPVPQSQRLSRVVAACGCY